MNKFGVVLTTAQPPGSTQEQVFDESIEQALLAERLGFDSAWLLEHHFTRYGLCSSPLVMASHILGATKTLHVGTAVSVVPLDHPIRLAEQVALIDQLSKGRLYFGVGRGGFMRDFNVFGVDIEQNHLITRDWVDIMIRAWTEETVSSDGPFLEFDPVEVCPKPWTSPHPPLYTASRNPDSLEWAAKHGIPLLLAHRMEHEAKMSVLEYYSDIAESAGHDPAAIDHVLSCVAVVADTRAEATERIRAKLDWWEERGARDTQLFDTANPPSNYSFLFRDARTATINHEASQGMLETTFRVNPIGTEEECIEKLQEVMESTGVRHVVCGFEGSYDHRETIESMERFAMAVMPKLQGELVGAE